MEIIYRADDGTLFKDEQECKDYENHFEKIRREVHIWDKDFNEISFDDFDWEEKICFFKCETEVSFNAFIKELPWDVIYEDFEKLDLFFAELNSDIFMTIREREKSLGNCYHLAKKFQEKLEKGE